MALRRAATLLAVLALLPSAADAGPTVAELVEVSDISSLSASPNGRAVAFRVERASIERNAYQLDWYVADLDTGEVRRIGGGGDAIEGVPEQLAVEPAVWSADGRFVFHRALVDNAIGIWRTAADGSGSRPVLVDDADVEQVVPGPGGRFLTYVQGPTREDIRRAERHEYEEGVLVDGSVELEQNLHRGGWVAGRLATQRLTGRWYSRAGLLWGAPRTRYRLDLASLETRALDRVDPAAQQPLTPGADVMLMLNEAGRPQVRVRDRDGRIVMEVERNGQSHACEEPSCRTGSIVALAWRPGTDDLIFTVQDRHFRQALYRWDTAGGGVSPIMRSEGLISGSRSETRPCAMTRAKAVCVASGPVSPPKLVVIDLATGRQSELFDPNASLRGRAAARVRNLTWRLPDGRAATGTLLLPEAGARPAPLFATYYYCPGYLRGGIGDEYPLAPLVDAGFVVACLNTVAGPPSDIVADYRSAKESLESLVTVLVGEGLVDPTRVGMGGFSAGSEATMFIAAHSTVLAAAAVASPQYNPSSYWSNARPDRDYAGVLKGFLGLGSPDETPERWKLVSPALNADSITAAVLMQLPENEARAQAEVYTRLRRGNTPVEMFAFPDESHIKFQPRHRRAVYARNLDWFRYWLQDYADPDPEKAAQYRRWDDLRVRRDEAHASNERSQVSAEASSSSRM